MSTDNMWQERSLTPRQIRYGIDTILRQIDRVLDTKRYDSTDPKRLIWVGINPGKNWCQAIYPQPGRPCSNNRTVVEGVVEAMRHQGYEAVLLEPRSKPTGGWSDVEFMVTLPPALKVER